MNRSPSSKRRAAPIRSFAGAIILTSILAAPARADDGSAPSIFPVAEARNSVGPGLAGRTIRVGGDWAYPPFEFLDETGNPTGFNVDLVRALTRVVGLPIEIRLSSWTEARSRLERGELDMLMGMFKSPERAGLVDFSMPHFVTVYRVFARAGSDIKQPGDIRNAWIAVQNGDMGHEFLVANGYGHRLIVMNEWTDLFKAVMRGEADCAVASTLQGWKAIEQKQFSSIEAVSAPLFSAEYCVAVAKGDAELLAAINEGLSVLRTTGEYQLLYSTWFGDYDEPGGGSSAGTIAVILATALTLILAVFVWGLMTRAGAREKGEELSAERTRLAESRKSLQDAVAEAEAAKVELTRAEQERSAFLAWLNREFRDPLERMIDAFDRMAGTCRDPEGERALAAARQSAAGLDRKLSDLLDATGAEKGRLRLEPSEFYCGDLAARLEPSLRAAAESRGLAFRFSCSGQDRALLADRARVEQIVTSLCANAIAYTDKGEVELTMALNDDSLYLSVKDTGPGLPDEARQRMFKPYYKTAGARGDAPAGLGLGLTVVKSVVDAMGGSIRYETHPSIGTHFEVSLPMGVRGTDGVSGTEGAGGGGGTGSSAAAPRAQARAEPAAQTGAAQVAAAAPSSKRGGRAIIAEDEAINRLYLKRVLEAAGYEVTPAVDGEVAMSAAATGRWDFILMDVSMPRMDGLEATRRIRASEAGLGSPRTPIIALTAHAYAEDREACSQAGMDGFLPKPFTEPALWAEVRRVVAATGVAAAADARADGGEAVD